ncbi:lytic transglycosylase domain-containing protein [Suttonella ornithocola]|uniref:Soluble lytic murein transglycosylase n=1 Tax=Suttonella ornithocola TaxID=279832 RepID=A0A380MQ41_9GAMM|nr:lytic transglycosylase domain-containing protein [Suttonella ornithocola]SUO93821.1 Soluble lytic murein transglycosylase precursor [Suttonella ornithocola]
MKKLLLIIACLPLPLLAAAKSCGSYVKNGKTHNIPCSLGKPLTSTIKAGQSCKAEIKVNGLTVKLRHQCVVKPTGQTGAITVTEPSGALKNRQTHLKQTINTLAKKYNVEPALAHAVITVESAYRSDIVSDKGAIGLMQLMPATAGMLSVTDPFDAKQNIDGGIRYLSGLLKRFNNDTSLALAGYNAGPEAVKKYGNTIPPYNETQRYVKRVLSYQDKYRQQWRKHIQ